MPKETNNSSAAVVNRSELEILLVEISTLFINIPADQIDSKIEAAQRRICKFLDLDRSTLWQAQQDSPGTMLLTHYYQPSEINAPPDIMRANDFFPWLLQKMEEGEVVSTSKISNLPAEAAVDKESFRIYGSKSGVYIPLSVGQGSLLGLLSFATTRKERLWGERIVSGLTLLAQMFSNILSRKYSDLALLKSETRLSLATKYAEAGLWDMNIGTGDVWVSEITRNLFHFAPDEKVHSDSFFKVIHPEDRERVHQSVQEAIQSGENFLSEYRVTCPNGKIRWISARGQQHTVSADKTDRLLGVATDISAHKQLELEREERLQFEKMLVDISSRFVNLPADCLDAILDDALERIAVLLNLDFIALWQNLAENGESPVVYKLTHMYPSDGDLKSSDLTEEQLPWYKQQMLAGKIASFSSLEELPPEAVQDREFARQLGIKSNLCIPLTVGGARSIGLIGFNTIQAERNWPKELVERLQLVAEIFTNALERRRMDEHLQKSFCEIETLKKRLEEENIYLKENVKYLSGRSEIIGKSTAIKKTLTEARQVARTDTTVLLIGETGTGKELLAEAIHNMSSRKDRTMVTINCASLPPTLIENELFGREKGAYTGAMTKMSGRFELADESTLFLDEIGELPLGLQSKLLRVIEAGTLERLGSTKSLKINTRIIAATNRDLHQEVSDGTFRQDLFYRLNVFPILMSPLRDRTEDIPVLARAFVMEFQKKLGTNIEIIPEKTLQSLKSYSWPGNVRELRNVIERAMILSGDGPLRVELPKKVTSREDDSGTLEDIIRREILAALEKTRWRISGPNGAAEILGLNRSTLESKMRKLGIHRTGS